VVEEQPESVKGIKVRIVEEIANLSRALNQIKGQDDEAVKEAHETFLKLSILIGEALDIKW
jgi:hypothetical protein